MTISTRITPILGTFFLGSPSQVSEGAGWYDVAYDHAVSLIHAFSDHGLTLGQSAGVIAALSPQNPWERNIRDAHSVCNAFYCGNGADDANTVTVGTFGPNLRKAIRILQGNSPETVLGGLKVHAFYRCILGHRDSVCVDGHAYSIWQGQRVSTTDTPKISPKLYAQIAQDYVDATELINRIHGANYSPAQIQAITWVVHRDLYKGQRRKARKAVAAK